MRTHIRNIGRWARQQSKLIVAIAVGVAIGGVGPAIVRAAIPDAGGHIYGCYTTSSTRGNPKGLLQVIDTEATPPETCPTGTVALNWDQHASSGGAVMGDFLPNLAGDDLTGLDFRYRNFANADLHGAILNGAQFTGADFHNANLSGTTLATRISMAGTDFAGVSFAGAVIGGADFNMFFTNNIAGANFSNATVSKTIFPGGTSMVGVNFTNVPFTTVNLTGSDLTPATLTGTTWVNVACPDGTNSDNDGNTCIGHLVP